MKTPMKRGFIISFLAILTIFSFDSSAQGLYPPEHKEVVSSAVALKKQVHETDKFDVWVDEAAKNFRTGVADEDSTIPGYDPDPEGPNGRGNYMQHFCIRGQIYV